MWAALRTATLLLVHANAMHSRGKPSVDPGLFMLMGVKTCLDGNGYCLMGLDCTLDDDFLPDDTGGHCNGLKNAFTPSAIFTCCKYNTDRAHVTTTRRPRPGLMKPTVITTETTTKDTVEVDSTVNADDTITEGAIITTTAADEQSDKIDVFVDINNEVIKEVIPPALDIPAEETAAEVVAVL